ncbi:uncharacterized protein LOC133335911 [Musca vetustissima]|uniref:uncharacterized protein LOC133335911 n=1 Tax=Musca vetustissima TaxID=27455 RepID=UPI002AB712BC|nr:uncharacterized protein LOC133335911 [Musca vetustissima]
MDVEVPILSGYLNVPTQSGFPLHRISKKKSCQKYCLLFKSSRYGIERLEICESKDDKNPKIITLENCVKITQEPSPANLICIVKKTATLTLNAINEESLKEWVNALQSVAFRSKNENSQNVSAIEEDNDLYCSSYDDGLFIVSLVPTEASIRCNIDPKCYILHLTATELQLKLANGSKNVISNWPYRFIRKYGYRDGKFTFEAGRKCSTGEGMFILDHTNPQDVFRCMSSKMKSMKKLISGDVVNIDNCENQLNAAASMEAGSRSPLPTSFSSQHSSELEINSNQILKGLTDPSCLVTLSPKTVPNKPPRRIVPMTEKPTGVNSQCISLNMEHNATNDNTKHKHIEAVGITTSDSSKAVGSTVILKPPSPNMHHEINSMPDPTAEAIACRQIFAERDYENLTYDRLEFLTANNRNSSGYKTIVPVNSTVNQCPATKPLQNEYELINVPDTDSCRKADDAHLGYGVLRKSRNSLFSSPVHPLATNIPSASVEEVNESQRNTNGINYTYVRKPKRV